MRIIKFNLIKSLKIFKMKDLFCLTIYIICLMRDKDKFQNYIMALNLYKITIKIIHFYKVQIDLKRIKRLQKYLKQEIKKFLIS